MEQLEKLKLIEFGTTLVAIAVMLGVLASVVLEKASKIDEGEYFQAGRVPVTDLTIEGCTEEACLRDFRMSKNDLRKHFIALKFPAVMKLDNGSIISSEIAFLFYHHRKHFPGRLVDQEKFFGRDYSTASRTFKAATDFLGRRASESDSLKSSFESTFNLHVILKSLD